MGCLEKIIRVNKKIALKFYKRYFFIRSLQGASAGRRVHLV